MIWLYSTTREWGQRVGKAKTRSYHFMEQVSSQQTLMWNNIHYFLEQNGVNMVLWRMEVEPHDRDDQVAFNLVIIMVMVNDQWSSTRSSKKL